MEVYLDVVFCRNFLLDLVLLMAASRLCGAGTGWKRLALGAGTGAVLAVLSYLPKLTPLATLPGILAQGVAVAAVAFRLQKRPTLAFGLLSMALGGLGWLLARFGFPGLLIGAAVVYLVGCRLSRGAKGGLTQARVRLGGQSAAFTVLRDTGNALRDPISGKAVLLLEARQARRLGLTLTEEEAADAAAVLPRLTALGYRCRLIPYRVVGGGGLLVALTATVEVDGRVEDLVAFVPGTLSPDGAYAGLTGGMAS